LCAAGCFGGRKPNFLGVGIMQHGKQDIAEASPGYGIGIHH